MIDRTQPYAHSRTSPRGNTPFEPGGLRLGRRSADGGSVLAYGLTQPQGVSAVLCTGASGWWRSRSEGPTVETRRLVSRDVAGNASKQQ